jgi:DNA-directed RNA polymerase subunit RPC12/RpoP
LETNSSSLKFYTDLRGLRETREESKCNACGEEFEQPLHAKVTSGHGEEEYYACPRCLSKIRAIKQREVEADEAEAEEQPDEIEIGAKPLKTDDAPACAHYLGYLKKRPKNSPIPEDCFICSKMIECM